MVVSRQRKKKFKKASRKLTFINTAVRSKVMDLKKFTLEVQVFDVYPLSLLHWGMCFTLWIFGRLWGAGSTLQQNMQR